MSAVSLLPAPGPSRPLEAADLDGLPDDGRRHELIDGVLVVSPAPRMAHQRALSRLVRLLDAACPDTVEAFVAPFDVHLATDTVVQPDLLLARVSELEDRGLSVPPALVVEILSPSTRLLDLNLKKARYEAAACPAYWAVDPDEPSITAWELRDGAYVEAGRASGDETLRAALPFEVQVVPADLVGPRRR